MIPDATAPRPEMPMPTDAGFEYFSTPAHYQSLAARILAALAGGGRFVLLTGSPPANGRLLAKALGKAAAGSHTVIEVPCGDGVTSEDWRRLVPGASGEIEVQEFSAAALLVVLGTPLPLYVLEEADRLSDEQLREFFATWLFGEPTIGLAVLVVTPAFLSRLERPTLSFLIEGLAARMLFQHLGPDEIAPFIRSQLGPGDADSNLTADSIASIAAASGGDPSLVNRFAFRTRDRGRMATAAPLTPTPARPTPLSMPAEPPAITAVEATARESDTAMAALPSAVVPDAHEDHDTNAEATPPMSPARRRLIIGASFVVAYVGILLLLGTLIPRHFHLGQQAAVEVEPSPSPTTRSAAKPMPEPAQAAVPIATPGTSAVGANPSGNNVAEQPLPPPPPASAEHASQPQPQPSHATAAAEPRPATPAAGGKIVADAAPNPAALSPSAAPERSAATPPTPAAATTPAPVAAQPPSTPAASIKTPPTTAAPPTLSTDAIAALVARGDALLDTGDIVSARLYYERAADGGDGHAARLMAETFDPGLIERAGLRSIKPDLGSALLWYRRARDLGDRAAAERLQALENPK